MRKTTILFIIMDLCAIICFVLFYGPFEKFRNIIVNTAMVTKSHQYIAYTFYSEDTVQKIMDLNIIYIESLDININRNQLFLLILSLRIQH